MGFGICTIGPHSAGHSGRGPGCGRGVGAVRAGGVLEVMTTLGCRDLRTSPPPCWWPPLAHTLFFIRAQLGGCSGAKPLRGASHGRPLGPQSSEVSPGTPVHALPQPPRFPLQHLAWGGQRTPAPGRTAGDFESLLFGFSPTLT